jgi:hypothetical protein
MAGVDNTFSLNYQQQQQQQQQPTKLSLYQ